MDESSLRLGMADTEVTALKDAVSSQQQALQKLQAELEKEREASASAASEAVSMILRLQGERAAEKMEAHQYKRMAEEKMRLGNESLAVFEELMHGKEMEVASLEYQVQAYKEKLSSVGFIDLGIADKKFADHGTVRRNASLPVIRFKGSKYKSGAEGMHPMSLLEDTDDEDTNCIREQTDECVEESSHNKSINEGIQSKWDSKNKMTRVTNETCYLTLNNSKPSCSSSQAEDTGKDLEFDADNSCCSGNGMVGERAADKMEAQQYKRMAEEKMRLGNQSLSVFKELMHGKEMEVSSLEYQVQAYKEKLSSVGFIYLGIADKKFADHGTVRRNASLPVIRFKGSKCKSGAEGMHPMSLLEDTDDEDTNCIHEQTDECVEESSRNKSINEGIQSKWDSKNKMTRATNETCYLNLNKSKPSCSSSQAEDTEKDLEFDADNSHCSGNGMVGSSMTSTSIHDIFEIPQNYDIQQLREPRKKVKQTSLLETENRLGEPDSVHYENSKYHSKDENQWKKKAVLYATDKSKLSTPQDGVKIEYFWPRLDSKIGITPKAEIQKLDKRLQLIENEFRVEKKESSDRREEELQLLIEIREQLKTIQSQIRSLKPKKSAPDDKLMVTIMEAMLHYSL